MIKALQVIAIVAVTKTKNALLNSGTVGLGETGLLEASDMTKTFFAWFMATNISSLALSYAIPRGLL